MARRRKSARATKSFPIVGAAAGSVVKRTQVGAYKPKAATFRRMANGSMQAVSIGAQPTRFIATNNRA